MNCRRVASLAKRAARPFANAPGNRGLWLKTKCLNWQEFVVVGWTEGEGARQALGSLLLGYWEGKRLVYAASAGGRARAVPRGGREPPTGLARGSSVDLG